MVADLLVREFRAPAPPRPPPGRGCQPGAPALGGLGLPLRSRARTSSTSACGGCARSSARMRPSKRCGMAVTALLRRRWVEIAWFAFAARTSSPWLSSRAGRRSLPFHLDQPDPGLRLPGLGAGVDRIVLGLVILATGSLILSDAFSGEQLWGELFEVPLMSAMFLAMVWHARRRQDAVRPRGRGRASARPARPSEALPA